MTRITEIYIQGCVHLYQIFRSNTFFYSNNVLEDTRQAESHLVQQNHPYAGLFAADCSGTRLTGQATTPVSLPNPKVPSLHLKPLKWLKIN